MSENKFEKFTDSIDNVNDTNQKKILNLIPYFDIKKTHLKQNNANYYFEHLFIALKEIFTIMNPKNKPSREKFLNIVLRDYNILSQFKNRDTIDYYSILLYLSFCGCYGDSITIVLWNKQDKISDILLKIISYLNSFDFITDIDLKTHKEKIFYQNKNKYRLKSCKQRIKLFYKTKFDNEHSIQKSSTFCGLKAKNPIPGASLSGEAMYTNSEPSVFDKYKSAKLYSASTMECQSKTYQVEHKAFDQMINDSKIKGKKFKGRSIEIVTLDYLIKTKKTPQCSLFILDEIMNSESMKKIWNFVEKKFNQNNLNSKIFLYGYACAFNNCKGRIYSKNLHTCKNYESFIFRNDQLLYKLENIGNLCICDLRKPDTYFAKRIVYDTKSKLDLKNNRNRLKISIFSARENNFNCYGSFYHFKQCMFNLFSDKKKENLDFYCVKKILPKKPFLNNSTITTNVSKLSLNQKLSRSNTFNLTPKADWCTSKSQLTYLKSETNTTYSQKRSKKNLYSSNSSSSVSSSSLSLFKLSKTSSSSKSYKSRCSSPLSSCSSRASDLLSLDEAKRTQSFSSKSEEQNSDTSSPKIKDSEFNMTWKMQSQTFFIEKSSSIIASTTKVLRESCIEKSTDDTMHVQESNIDNYNNSYSNVKLFKNKIDATGYKKSTINCSDSTEEDKSNFSSVNSGSFECIVEERYPRLDIKQEKMTMEQLIALIPKDCSTGSTSDDEDEENDNILFITPETSDEEYENSKMDFVNNDNDFNSIND